MRMKNKSVECHKKMRLKAKRRLRKKRLLYMLSVMISLALIYLVSKPTYDHWNSSKKNNDIGKVRKQVHKVIQTDTAEESEYPEATHNAVLEDQDAVSAISSARWMLTVVNEQNPLPGNYLPKLKKLKNGLLFDERAIDSLKEMLSDAKAQGLSPIVCSAYRTVAKQQKLFDEDVYKYMQKGLSQQEAEEETRKSVAYPGTSEHNMGLAVDIVSKSYQLLNEKQERTREMKWLVKHCAEYGFILRYPKGKEDITGVNYEPWHFRFVGVEAAQKIMQEGITLEEYLMKGIK